MLIEKKIKISETKRKKSDINIVSAVYDEGVITITAPNHNIVPGTNLYLERSCGDGETFIKSFNVYDVVDKDTFKIEYNLDNYLLKPESVEKVTTILDINTGACDCLLYTFSENNKHICCEDRSDVTIRDLYNSTYTFEYPVRNCKPIDVLFNDITYYRSDKIDIYGNRVLEMPLNITDHYIWLADNEYGKIELGCAFIPLSPNGYDNRTLMYIPFNGDIENIDSKALFCLDCRFFNLDGIKDLTSGITINLSKGTLAYVYPETLNIQFGLSDEFKLNLIHEEEVESYIIEKKQTNVSDIIDFEKRVFEPTYITSGITEENLVDEGSIKDLKSIRFNVFLRDRIYDSKTGDWSAPDENYWYSFQAGSNGRAKIKTKLADNANKGDLLGSLGFDDEDVINQSKQLNKTFLRLLFYDKPDRATQTLLFYSTMFVNTSKQYAKYMRNVASNVPVKDSIYDKIDSEYYPEYVRTVNSDDDLALCTNFIAYDKFNMSGSSEGFYLYLFPDIVNGAEITELYMMAELNHAKYGTTIPLICPFENNKQVTPRLNYLKNDSEYGNFIDLKSLYNDMYVKVCVKHDYSNNRYVWFLPNVSDSNELVLKLYEPRINESKISK